MTLNEKFANEIFVAIREFDEFLIDMKENTITITPNGNICKRYKEALSSEWDNETRGDFTLLMILANIPKIVDNILNSVAMTVVTTIKLKNPDLIKNYLDWIRVEENRKKLAEVLKNDNV